MTKRVTTGLGPSLVERLARLRADLRAGVPGVVNAGDHALLFVPAETLSSHRLAAIRSLGNPCVVLTARRAETLKARAYDGDLARIAIPNSAGLPWILGLADPARDLETPMKGPLMAERGGSAELHRLALRMVKTAHLLPTVVALQISPESAASLEAEGLTAISADELAHALDHKNALQRIVAAHVPLRFSKDARLHVFRPDDGGEEHYAIEIGKPDRTAPVLARLHSACFTGDLLGSLKCDCGPQLHAALTEMGQAGSGVLLYLNQEGRGIGLANKMRAYALQDQGFDTVEANHRLGFEDDERDFRLGAAILRDMGFSAARLMTNNPAKVDMLAANGIEVVERVPLQVGHTEQNARYLATKAAKSGHDL
jgi:GTP cyclohydrolase II